MHLQTFLDIQSENEEIRKAATEAIQLAQSDTGFLNYLLQSIQTNEAQSNLILFKSLLVILVHTARKYNDNFKEILNNPESKQLLIQLLFAVPIELRQHVEELLLISAIDARADFSQLFTIIFDKVNQNFSFPDLYTALSFSNKWIKNSLSTDYFTNVSQIILPLLQACTSEPTMDNMKAQAITELAHLTKLLISRGHIIFNDSFDQVIIIFCQLFSQPFDSELSHKMKAVIAKFLASLVVFVCDKWKTVKELEEWKQHFSTTLLPVIFTSTMAASQQPMNGVLIGRLFYIFYLFLSFEIMPDKILTPEFFNGIVIPAARLSESDLSDYSDNPEQFISFCCTHSNVGFFSPRVCASNCVGMIMTKYIEYFNPLPLLLDHSQAPDDSIDFEARLYLLQRYSMKSELPWELFENYFNLLTQPQPQYIVAALLRLSTGPLSKGNNSVVGISIAEHFIINSEDPVAQDMAAILMSECFADFGDTNLGELKGIVDINTNALLPALLNLSNSIYLPDPVILIHKILKFGPDNYETIVIELIKHFFTLWRDNQAIPELNPQSSDITYNLTNSSLLESIITILESIPYNSQLIIELATPVLTQLLTDLTEFPNNETKTDQLRIAAVLMRKIEVPIEIQIDFIRALIEMDFEPLSIATSFAELVCPLIVKPNFDFYQFGFHEYIIKFCQTVLQPDEQQLFADQESMSQCLVLASCLIQTKGEEFFPFVATAINILVSKEHETLKKKNLLIFGAIHVFAAALLSDAEKAHTLFIPEIPDLICEVVPEMCISAAYREIKLTVTVLTFFAKFGHNRSFEVAASLFQLLFDTKALVDKYDNNPDNRVALNEEQIQQGLTSLSPLLTMPIDGFDEMSFFMELSAEQGLIGSIQAHLEGLLGE